MRIPDAEQNRQATFTTIKTASFSFDASPLGVRFNWIASNSVALATAPLDGDDLPDLIGVLLKLEQLANEQMGHA